ncbi:MAG: V-type ATP synthase subunit I [Nanobdellota archaeon]
MSRSETILKTNIFALREDRDRVISDLHKKGVMQLIDMKSQDIDIAHADLGEKHKETSDCLLRMSRLVNIQKMPSMKLTFSQKMFGFDLPDKKEVKSMSDDEVMKDAEGFLDKNEKTLLDLEAKYTSAEERKEQLKEKISAVKQLGALGIPIKTVNEIENLSFITGTILSHRFEEMKEQLDSEIGDYAIESAEYDKKYRILAVAVFNDSRDKANFIMKNNGLHSIQIPDVREEDAKAYLDRKVSECDDEMSEALKEIKKVRKGIYARSVALREELELVKERSEAVNNMRESSDFFMMQGWVPVSKLDDLRSVEGIGITTEKAEEGNEQVPVKMKNKKWLKPLETITELYSPPRYKDLDPTFITGPAFVLFAGFMLTDFIYGLGLFLLGLLLCLFFGKYDKGLKDMTTIIAGMGVVSMIFGILTGSYFGDLPKYLIGLNTADLAIWKDPLNEPLYFLIISIIVALVHVNIGLILGAIEDFRKKQYKKFVSERLVWWTIQLAVAALALQSYIPSISGALDMTGKILGIASVVMVVGMKGPLGLLDITGFMGDVISYSRLFALALSTAGIAMTVNLLVDLLWPIPYGVGIVAGILVFLGGHMFSFAMNALGSFVHSIRLQFVEFFGKFYEGGGDRFEPFREERVYTEEVQKR